MEKFYHQEKYGNSVKFTKYLCEPSMEYKLLLQLDTHI